MSYIGWIEPWNRKVSANQSTPSAAHLMLLAGAVWLLVVAAVLTLMPQDAVEIMVHALEAGA